MSIKKNSALLLNRLGSYALKLGFNFDVIKNFKNYPLYRNHRNAWLAQGGAITKNYMILSDYAENAGSSNGHYFHQDLLVANFIFKDNPVRHVDVGSRIDGFIAHLASFREVEVFDIRPMVASVHKNIIFRQVNLMELNNKVIEPTESLSCLHAIEHFGLGRYTDPIDINGHLKGIDNLVKLVKHGGLLYISFPIGLTDEVHFNAHRVFHPQSILSFPGISDSMKLVRFDFVNDLGDLVLNASLNDAVGNVKFGCGIYTFQKII